MNSIERTQGAKPAIFMSPRALWTAIARASGATLPLSSQQVTSHQVAIATTALLGEVLGLRRLLPDQRLLSGVTGITVDPPLGAVQQVRQRMLVMHVGRTRRHRMNQLGLAVHADVRLHPEVPLVTLLRLLHLRVPLAFLILGRTGRVDDRGIDDGTGGDSQALGLQMGI